MDRISLHDFSSVCGGVDGGSGAVASVSIAFRALGYAGSSLYHSKASDSVGDFGSADFSWAVPTAIDAIFYGQKNLYTTRLPLSALIGAVAGVADSATQGKRT